MEKVRVFICQAMSSLTEEEIFEVRNKAKEDIKSILKGKEVEIIDNYHHDNITEEDIKEARVENLLYLGNSIAKLAKADFAYFCHESNSRGCKVERLIIDLYHIPILNNLGEDL